MGHDHRAARIVKGLEGAIVNADVMRLAALDTTDARAFHLRVAGPAALLVAKVHKISERQGTGRHIDKDALDVLRLLRGTETDDLASRYEKLFVDARSAEAAKAGRRLFETLFATPRSPGVVMAICSAGALGNPDEIAASCEALAGDLLEPASVREPVGRRGKLLWQPVARGDRRDTSRQSNSDEPYDAGKPKCASSTNRRQVSKESAPPLRRRRGKLARSSQLMARPPTSALR